MQYITDLRHRATIGLSQFHDPSLASRTVPCNGVRCRECYLPPKVNAASLQSGLRRASGLLIDPRSLHISTRVVEARQYELLVGTATVGLGDTLRRREM